MNKTFKVVEFDKIINKAINITTLIIIAINISYFKALNNNLNVSIIL